MSCSPSGQAALRRREVARAIDPALQEKRWAVSRQEGRTPRSRISRRVAEALAGGEFVFDGVDQGFADGGRGLEAG